VLGALLTRAGIEALKIVPPTEDLEVIKHVAEQSKKFGPTKVQIGEIVRSPEGKVTELRNLSDV
jgi:hypothetical protein